MPALWACLACDREWTGNAYQPGMDAREHCGDDAWMVYFPDDNEKIRAVLAEERDEFRGEGQFAQ
jgi:hypothetical protein